MRKLRQLPILRDRISRQIVGSRDEIVLGDQRRAVGDIKKVSRLIEGGGVGTGAGGSRRDRRQLTAGLVHTEDFYCVCCLLGGYQQRTRRIHGHAAQFVVGCGRRKCLHGGQPTAAIHAEHVQRGRSSTSYIQECPGGADCDRSLVGHGAGFSGGGPLLCPATS